MSLSGPEVGEAATWLSIVSQLYASRMGALLHSHELTLQQFSILHHIARQKIGGAMRVSDIARAVDAGQPAVTKAVAKFAAMGLVEVIENAGDKRSKLITATPAAGALIGQVHAQIGPDLHRAFSAIPAEDFPAFSGALKSLGQWLDAHRLPAPK